MPPNPAFAYFGATTPSPTTVTQPLPGTEPAPDWLDVVGRTARHIGTQAAAELQQAAGGRQQAPGGFAPSPSPNKPPLPGAFVPMEQAPYQPIPQLNPRRGGMTAGGPMPSPSRPAQGAGGPPQMPGMQTGEGIDLDPGRAARGLVKRSPALQRAIEDPATAIEEASGRGVDEVYAEMRRTVDAPLPDEQDLSRQEKGMLMLEMGLRIMGGGPGLMAAIGNAGLHTMGNFAEMQARKREQTLDLLGTEMDVALSREEREAKAREPMRVRPGEQLVRPDTGETVASVPERTKPLSSAGKLRADLESGLITREEYDRAVESGGLEPTALMREVPWLADLKGISEADAADYLLLSAASRTNPDKLRDDIYKIALREAHGDAEEAGRITEQSMRMLEGGPEALPEQPAEQAPQGVVARAWSAIKEAAQSALAGQEGATGTSVTGRIPEATTEVAPAPLPEDPTQLEAGQVYEHQGRRLRWDGEAFEVVE